MAVKIGFVGAGWVATQHFKSLAQVPEANIVACTDVDEDKAAEAAARFAGAAAYTDYRNMLDSQELDAVYVCLPPHVHGEMELALIDAGIPFFVEKPLSHNLETAERILEALEPTTPITAVGYMMRYADNAARVKELLAEETPVVARSIYACGVPGPPWWRRKEQSGGQVVEQTTHLFDLACYLFGEVESVYCRPRRGLITDMENYNTDDASACSLLFESGLLCDVISTCAVNVGERSLEVFTPDTRAKLSDGTGRLTIERKGERADYSADDDLFLKEDRAFVEAVSTGDASGIRSDYRDAFRTHRVTCAANESMESGQPVLL